MVFNNDEKPDTASPAYLRHRLALKYTALLHHRLACSCLSSPLIFSWRPSEVPSHFIVLLLLLLLTIHLYCTVSVSSPCAAAASGTAVLLQPVTPTPATISITSPEAGGWRGLEALVAVSAQLRLTSADRGSA